MKKTFFKILFLFLVMLTPVLSLGQAKAFDGPETIFPTDPKQLITAKKLDPKAEILREYLTKHNSPLQYHAQDFIDAANLYDLDWRLVAAISGTESTFGKHIPGGYNGWGWGVYGTQAIYFSSWKEAIFTISQGLRENYVNLGYTEPYSMNRKYAASPHWAKSVTFFMNDIDRFAIQYQSSNDIVGINNPLDRIAAASGLLAFK